MNDAQSKILLIEDNAGDIRLLKEAISEGSFRALLHVERNGLDALHFLQEECTRTDNLCPDLILLDLNLPKMNGVDFLTRLRHCNSFQDIPVIVLSGSRSDGDIETCLELGALRFLHKPACYEEYQALLREVEFAIKNIPTELERDTVEKIV